VLCHVPDVHRAGAEVLRNFPPTKRCVLLAPPSSSSLPPSSGCCSPCRLLLSAQPSVVFDLLIINSSQRNRKMSYLSNAKESELERLKSLTDNEVLDDGEFRDEKSAIQERHSRSGQEAACLL